ncbi:DUF805 domain-containing protein [Sphingomonas sp.]|jgi:uncharacterized membrane protein YhaH (DUF805 family)|uniref:DUF805 domain-containing protein n=1 Tax=Sphingomonas sp. TaxID=28214 RepID=UPI002E320C50|nr:DUF805 domain-containing protein [Sphingomonas sp.]HEX4693534.1 DUF805 domain-containing protein [Sphingomonas sp.]
MNLLTRHLAGLADFNGRENRQPFWLWMLIVYATQMVVGTIVMIPMIVSTFHRLAPMMQGDPHRFDEHPELVRQIMSQVMVPMISNMMTYLTIAAIVMIGLVAAAVVRRLHDGDHSGWWAAPIFAYQLAMPLIYAAALPKFFAAFPAIRPGMSPDQVNAAMAPAIQSIAWVSLLGTIGFLMLIVLIVVLALKGTEGPNRYGDDPLLH